MFEDEVRNLEVPHAMGLRTVHVAPEKTGHDYVHFHTDDLTAFLRQIST
jgi:putative hydrolase of the HAD superfamily